ncbi:MAG: acyl-CoA dehydrogenase family protein [Gammaproteobacteria bacterium]|nr:acyl-CoA dehydrogenase family protein [Gammaproteobacteria bacterium]
MDLSLTPEEKAFQTEVREFLDAKLPADIREKSESGRRVSKEDQVRWQKILNEQGWMAPGWPKEYGGTGWSPIQKYIFDEEMAAASAPPVLAFGVSMVAPVIIRFGTEAQKAHYLPRILSSEDWWCQGYSEPGAGSDLASLKTRAESDGDHYIVNGQKTWTTLAQHADWIFCLVRTNSDGKKQEGISFLLIDMKTPGITVKPIVTIDGGREINETFFENVRVPKTNLIGEEGKGWTYAKFLLGHERTGIAGVARSKKQVLRLKALAKAEESDGAPLFEDAKWREKLARIEVDLMALEYTNLKMVSEMNAGQPPGPSASILKLKGTEIQQAITALLMETVGYYAHPFQPDADSDGWNEEPVGPDYAATMSPAYFNLRKASIYGGSNEIQRNIIAKMVLGM